jgi:hypothetical protein
MKPKTIRRELAAIDTRIRYHRNDANIGVAGNYNKKRIDRRSENNRSAHRPSAFIYLEN